MLHYAWWLFNFHDVSICLWFFVLVQILYHLWDTIFVFVGREIGVYSVLGPQMGLVKSNLFPSVSSKNNFKLLSSFNRYISLTNNYLHQKKNIIIMSHDHVMNFQLRDLLKFSKKVQSNIANENPDYRFVLNIE